MTGRPRAIPVVVVSGFLGAGKTTLLNHVLRRSAGRRIVALVNDFGAINLDADLVVKVDAGVVELSNGCVCCDIRGDLIGASLAALQRLENPDLLIVETSGISDARSVASTFLRPELRKLLTVSAILGLVDAAHFLELDGAMAELAQAQLSAADIVVINKLDLVGADGLAGIRTAMRRMVPEARIVETFHGNLPVELVFDEAVAPKPRSPLFAGSALHQGFASCHWECGQPLSLAKLRCVFEELSHRVYRAKGIVHVRDLPGHRVVLQAVGRRSSIASLGSWGDESPSSRILLIGERPTFIEAEIRASLETAIARAHDESSPLEALLRTLERPKGPAVSGPALRG